MIRIWKAQLVANARAFLEQFLQKMREARLRKLGAEVRHHPARDLVLVVECVVFLRHAKRFALLLGNATEVVADFLQQRVVHVHAEPERAQVLGHGLRRRLRVAVG